MELLSGGRGAARQVANAESGRMFLCELKSAVTLVSPFPWRTGLRWRKVLP